MGKSRGLGRSEKEKKGFTQVIISWRSHFSQNTISVPPMQWFPPWGCGKTGMWECICHGATIWSVRTDRRFPITANKRAEIASMTPNILPAAASAGTRLLHTPKCPMISCLGRSTQLASGAPGFQSARLFNRHSSRQRPLREYCSVVVVFRVKIGRQK